MESSFEERGKPTGAAPSFPDMHIVHLCPSTGSFLSSALDSQCNVYPIHEISSKTALKQAYKTLGEVSHATMLWLTISKECLADDKFWINLRKIILYVRKGSGRIVFHMPRKSRSWQHSGVKEVLDSYGLHKVSFDFDGEKHIVATNDATIREFLNPHSV